MAESSPFSFEELGGAIHKFMVNIFAATDERFTK